MAAAVAGGALGGAAAGGGVVDPGAGEARAAAPKLVNNQGLTRGVVNNEKKASTVYFAQGDADGNLFGNVERMLCGAT